MKNLFNLQLTPFPPAWALLPVLVLAAPPALGQGAPPAHPAPAPAIRTPRDLPPGFPPAPGTTPAAAPGPDPAKASAAPPKLEIASDDRAHRLRLGGLLHADLRTFFADSGVTTFALRRARPILEGHVYRYYDFRLQTDFAGGRLQLLDAYANLHFIDEVQLLVGKARGPIVLERLQSPQGMTFVERGFPSQLGPNRDIGAKLHGKLASGAIEWAVGVYNGVPNGQSGDVDSNDAKDVAGRLLILPHKALAVTFLEIGLGAAGAIGDQQAALPTYVTSGQQPFFSYGSAATAFGRRTILTPQGYVYVGPFGLMSELVRVREHIVSTTGATGTVGSRAFQVAGTVVLGGKPSYQGVKVERPLDPHAGGFGALELSARYHSLRVGDLAYRRGFANRATAAALARAFTVGGSWHFANGQRALVNYERTTFRGGSPNGTDRKPESVLLTRLQASF